MEAEEPGVFEVFRGGTYKLEFNGRVKKGRTSYAENDYDSQGEV